MHRISTGFSMIALAAAMGCLSLPPQSGESHPADVATHRPDFSSAGIDPMPVGTAKQISRMKRARGERKA